MSTFGLMQLKPNEKNPECHNCGEIMPDEIFMTYKPWECECGCSGYNVSDDKLYKSSKFGSGKKQGVEVVDITHIHDQIIKNSCNLYDSLKYSIFENKRVIDYGILGKDIDYTKKLIEKIKTDSSQLVDCLEKLVEYHKENLDKKP